MFLKSGDYLVFQGDSITDAFRKPEEVGTSYRLGAGWAMMVAAQLSAEHPEMNLRFENRGVAGNRLKDLHHRWDADCLDLKPTVLNLLVGVNETLRRFTGQAYAPADDFVADLRGLLDRTRQALPGIRFILCEPFLLEAGAVKSTWFDDMRERQGVIRSLAAEYGAVFVPLQRAFDEAAERTGPAYWLFDGIHPNAAGQWLIMQQWRRAVVLA